MEIILGVVIIVALLFFITGSAGFVASAAAVFIELLAGFFIFFSIRALTSEKTEARFLRFEKNEKTKMESAVYSVKDKEVFDIFPAEPLFLRKHLYKEEKSVSVRFSEKRGEVYDKCTLATITIGTAVLLPSAVVIPILLISFFFK